MEENNIGVKDTFHIEKEICDAYSKFPEMSLFNMYRKYELRKKKLEKMREDRRLRNNIKRVEREKQRKLERQEREHLQKPEQQNIARKESHSIEK